MAILHNGTFRSFFSYTLHFSQCCVSAAFQCVIDEQHIIEESQVLLPVTVHLGVIRVDHGQEVLLKGMSIGVILIPMGILVTIALFPFQHMLYDGVILLQGFPVQTSKVMLDVFLRHHCGDLDI